MTTAGFFRLALCGLNALGKQRKLLATVDRLHITIRSSDEQMCSSEDRIITDAQAIEWIQSLGRKFSAHPAELESGQYDVRRLEASFEEINRQFEVSQAEAILVEARCDWTRALIDGEAQKKSRSWGFNAWVAVLFQWSLVSLWIFPRNVSFWGQLSLHDD